MVSTLSKQQEKESLFIRTSHGGTFLLGDLRKASFIVLCTTMLLCCATFVLLTCHRCNCLNISPPHRDQILQRIVSLKNNAFSLSASNIDSDSKSQRRFPDAIIIGVKKCGTRALLEFIRLHPDVRAPGPETHFFDRNYHLGFDWYRDHMPATLHGQLTIEKTPSYFISEHVAERIHAFNPHIKLVVVVRNPVVRAISDYTQSLSKNPGLASFEQMVLKNGSINEKWNAVRLGIYSTFLETWLRYFDKSQIHFVSGEKLISNPAAVVTDLQGFLKLKPVVGERHFYFNRTKGFPCIKKPVGSPTPRCLGASKGRTHPLVKPGVLERLKNFYQPHNEAFYRMTGKRFDW